MKEHKAVAPDAVKTPAHYCADNIELVDVWRGAMTTEQLRGLYRGNVLKYLFRYDKKNGVEDLRKAQVYLELLIETFSNDN